MKKANINCRSNIKHNLGIKDGFGGDEIDEMSYIYRHYEMFK